MRKGLSFGAILALFFVSCSNENIIKPYVVQYAESLVYQYPNYASNEIAKEVIKDSISNHAKSYIGNYAKDLNSIEFHFDKLLNGKDSKCAVFTSSSYLSVDAPVNSQNKYICAFLKIIAFGKVDDVTAAKLDKNMKYSISGILHEWDGDNTLNILTSSSYDDLDFGTYILDGMIIKEISNE